MMVPRQSLFPSQTGCRNQAGSLHEIERKGESDWEIERKGESAAEVCLPPGCWCCFCFYCSQTQCSKHMLVNALEIVLCIFHMSGMSTEISSLVGWHHSCVTFSLNLYSTSTLLRSCLMSQRKKIAWHFILVLLSLDICITNCRLYCFQNILDFF